MDIEQLKQLVSKGESQQLEFKKTTCQLKPAFETLCAFLNGGGGTVLFGVTDNGQILGQQVHDKTRQELSRELSKIEPKATPDIHYIDVAPDKQVIVIEATSGKHIPYAFNGRAYERNQSTTERMTQHRYEQLIIQRGQLNHDWDEYPANDYTIDDLDHEEIQRTIKEGVDLNRISVKALSYSIEQVLNNLQLIDHGTLNHAAVVLYAKDPETIYNRCMIRLARFKGVDNIGDFIDNQQVSGNAFHLISTAIEFALRYLPIASYFEPNRPQRIDQPAVPVLALREALINAVCHRDYTVRNATLSMAIYDDRLEIWNVGELPPQLEINDLREPHGSYPRNETIAKVFYKRGWIESWGTGTLRMIGYCKQNKTPEPEFIQYSGGFAVVFKFKTSMGTAPSNKPSFNELTTRQKEIIAILQNAEAMPLKEISEHLQKPPATSTLREELTTLKTMGLINSQGQARATTWFLIKK